MAPRTGTSREARGRARRARRAGGFTLLEAVLAGVLLALVAVAFMNTVSLLARLQTDDVQRLGAYELANRKILEYLDDKNSIGSDSQAQELYGFRYRWHLDETPVRMTVKASEASVRSSQQLNPERFRRITVTVWIVDTRASSAGNDVKGDQMAQLTRVYDPFGILFRNADSRNNQLTKDGGLAEIMQMFGPQGGLGGMGGGGTPTGGTPTGGTPTTGGTKSGAGASRGKGAVK